MNKNLLYGAISISVVAGLFTWWWTLPANYIERVTTFSVPSAETLFSASKDSDKFYLLKVNPKFVKKVVDGCELHGGTFASVDQTSAALFSQEAEFKAHGLFSSEHIGCHIKGEEGATAWEFYVKDDLLYFHHIR